ncbi:hypothetical protein BDR04DRAFT_1184813 [Suillus decipiens]|nr:hypothetical protein BDR04DRAFT_1184813 [Suillus decipiens]
MYGVSRQRSTDMVVIKLVDVQPNRELNAKQSPIPEAQRDISGNDFFTDDSNDTPRREAQRNSSSTVEVVPARDEDRYGIAPESDAEAAAAMQRTNDNESDDSMQPTRPEVGAQASQVRPIQTHAQGSTGGAEDIVYEGVSCCVFFFGRRRSTSLRS